MPSSGHSLPLVSAHRMLARQREELERAAVGGAAPGGGPLPLTPVPPEMWSEIERELAGIAEIAERLVRRNAPGHLPDKDEVQPLRATLRWVSLLLQRMEETLESIDPEALERKCGPLPNAAERPQFQADYDEMRGRLAAAELAVERWRTAPARSENEEDAL